MSDDYEIGDLPCPACGNNATHSRHCSAFDCLDGYIDESHDDPINFAPGEEFSICRECKGHGIERWCPSCGADYWVAKHAAMRRGEIQTCDACNGSGSGDRDECEKCSGRGWARVKPVVTAGGGA